MEGVLTTWIFLVSGGFAILFLIIYGLCKDIVALKENQEKLHEMLKLMDKRHQIFIEHADKVQAENQSKFSLVPSYVHGTHSAFQCELSMVYAHIRRYFKKNHGYNMTIPEIWRERHNLDKYGNRLDGRDPMEVMKETEKDLRAIDEALHKIEEKKHVEGPSAQPLQ